MNYVEFVNQCIKARISEKGPLVVYGQNVSTGSCLSGLSRGIDQIPGCVVINTPNSENTLVGVGFGMLLAGVSSIFFMKQLDFLALGVDQLVNTWNALRRRNLTASFTIVAIVVDSGWEGPQSCLNALPDFCSVSRIPGFTVSNRYEIELVFEQEILSPGVRLIGLSQRLFRTPLLNPEKREIVGEKQNIIRYSKGPAATIVAFNLAFPEALKLRDAMAAAGYDASLFSIPAVLVEDFDPVLSDLDRTQRMVIVDDCKSVQTPALRLSSMARAAVPSARIVSVNRAWTPNSAAPNADRLNVDADAVMADLGWR